MNRRPCRGLVAAGCLLGGLAALCAALPLSADHSILPAGRQAVPLAVPLAAEPFELAQVRLLDGPFREAQKRDLEYLLALDVDRLLHTFRLNAGLPSTVQPLGGWEEPAGELRGHFAGHYLTGCSLMYAATGDLRLKAKVAALVAGLAECQAKLGSGYLSAYPESFIDRVEAQQRVWAPYYTLHKILAGLIDAAVYAENPQALDLARRFGDWVVARNGRLSEAQMQAMLGNEHGGINEAMANLYALTGNRAYLDMSLRLNHHALLDPAAQGTDNLTGLHANTQIPKFLGNARQYELTGQAELKAAARFFWDTVVHERSYVIGGHSDGEMFSPKETLSKAFGPSTTETCNTYNMLKLTRHLFCWDPQVAYADYYERALVNHILASQDPATGMMCYYVPLRPGSRKVYNGPLDSFWCCTGTGVENHAKYGDSIYFHAGSDTLYVNLFVASELNWKDRGVTLRQTTGFPAEPATTLELTCAEPTRLALKLRRPGWCGPGFGVTLNGAAVSDLGPPGSWITIDRTWKTGDALRVELPYTLRTEGFRDNPARLAFLHGPVVLAAEVEADRPAPAIVGRVEDALAAAEPVAGRSSTFRLPAALFNRLEGTGADPVVLEPFYGLHQNRAYTVYFDVYTTEAWQARLAANAATMAEMRALEAITVDVVEPGDEAAEQAHALVGERTQAGPYQDRHWRHAVDGGHFAWTLKVEPAVPQELWVTYWGSDGGNRVFDVLLDGETLATERLQDNRPGTFYVQKYPIPAAAIEGKQRLTVRFQAHPGATAGGAFEARIVRTPPAR